MAPSANLFMPKKKARVLPKPGSAAPAPAPASGPGPSLKALGKQRATTTTPQRSASPAVLAVSSEPEIGQDLNGRTYEEYDVYSMGTPPAFGSSQGESSGADFNVIRLYQLNSAHPVPDLAHPTGPIYFNRQNPNDRPLLGARAGGGGDDDKRDKSAKDAARQAVQNGPNGEWREPMMDRDGTHQIDQRTGEKMWRVVQDPTLVAPEARKSDKKGQPDHKRRRGGGGGGRGRDDRSAKVFARSGNFKDSEDSARNHQELNREKLPLVIEGTFPNPEYQPDLPNRLDSTGAPIPPTVDQKWVGKHQAVESERWAALMFENNNGQQRVTLKLIDREYKFEPHRHINVPSTSYDAGTLLQDAMEGKNHIGRFAYRNPTTVATDDADAAAGPSGTSNDAVDVKPAFRNTGTGGGNPDAFPRMLAPSRGRSMNRSAAGSFAVKLEQGAYGGANDDDDKTRVKREAGGYFFGDDDDAPRRGRGIERADDEELDYNEDVADDEEAVAMGVDDEEIQRETDSRLKEDFFRANATAGNLQREQTPESDDEVDPVALERKRAEQKRERKMRKRLRRERKARGEAASDEDDDEDDDEDSLFGSDDDSSTEGEEEDVKPVIEDIKPPITPATSIAPSVNSPTKSRPGSPSTARMGSARSVSPMASAGAGHHLVASRALSPQGKRSSASSRKRKNDESQTAPPEAGRSSVPASGALQSFKKSRPNTDAGERRITPSDAAHVPVASPIDVDEDVKPGTPVPGHPTGLPKHKARGKKKRVDESSSAAGTPRSGSPAVPARPAPSAAPKGNASQQPARDGSPAVGGSPVAHHPLHGPLTAEEYREAIAANYDGKITEADFLALLKGKDKITVKEIRDHFGKRMKKNQRGILSAKYLSWKFCNAVDGGFTLKKEFQ